MGRRPTDPRNFLRGTNRQGLGGSRRVRFHNGEYRSLGTADLIELRYVELAIEDSKEKSVNIAKWTSFGQQTFPEGLFHWWACLWFSNGKQDH